MKSIKRKFIIIIVFGMIFALSTIISNIRPAKGNDTEDGHYPATFSFEEDPVGTTGDTISFCDVYSIYYPEGDTGSTSNSQLIIIDEIDGHKKVLKFEEKDLSSQIFMSADFSSQSIGSVEFWFRTTDTSKPTAISLSQGGTALCNLLIMENKFMYQVNSWPGELIPNVADPVANKWHHILIHFRCVSASAYQELPENKWKVIIDGVDSGELKTKEGSLAYLDSIMLTTDNDYSDYNSYFDAIGYSWDPDYDIGDNKVEGSISVDDVDDDVSSSPEDYGETLGMFFTIIVVSMIGIIIVVFAVFSIPKKSDSEPILT